ncbi:MAG: hypothetical protein CVV58_06835, partial [Tenericutes bacterium HGW-Tenericutes-3]
PASFGAFAGAVVEFEAFNVDFSGSEIESPLGFSFSQDIGGIAAGGFTINFDPSGELSVDLRVGVGFGEFSSFSPSLDVELNKE